MSEKFVRKYETFHKSISNAKNEKQIKEAKKLIKEMENEINNSADTSMYTIDDINNMKKKVNECKYKLNETIEEIKIMQDRSKCDMTCNESSLSQLYNDPDNNTLSVLNNKMRRNNFKEEMMLKNKNEMEHQKITMSFKVKNEGKEGKENGKGSNGSKWSKCKVVVMIVAILFIVSGILSMLIYLKF